MDAYLGTFAESRLPLSPWIAGALWFALFSVTRRITVRSREYLAQQPHVVAGGLDTLMAMDRPGVVWPQFAMLTAVLALSWFLGETVYALIAGGMLLAMAMTLGLNLHSLAFAQRLARGGAAGTITLSARFILEDLARRASTGALVFAVAAAVLAHVALLGGALFLMLASVDLSRRARALAPPA